MKLLVKLFSKNSFIIFYLEVSCKNYFVSKRRFEYFLREMEVMGRVLNKVRWVILKVDVVGNSFNFIW